MEAKQILDYCLSSLNGTVLVESWGEKGIFYNPGLVLKRGVYVLTVKEKTVITIKRPILTEQVFTVSILGCEKAHSKRCMVKFRHVRRRAVSWIWIVISLL